MTSVPRDPGMSGDIERAYRVAQTEGNPVLRSGAPSELTFYILGQVKELLFTLVYE